MKIKCTECGTLIQTSDDNAERGKALMAAHVSDQHCSVEQKHAKTLTKCLAAFQDIAAGQPFTKFQAHDLAVEVSSLLKVPYAPKEISNENSVPAGTSQTDSVVQDAVPIGEGAVPAGLGDPSAV